MFKIYIKNVKSLNHEGNMCIYIVFFLFTILQKPDEYVNNYYCIPVKQWLERERMKEEKLLIEQIGLESRRNFD